MTNLIQTQDQSISGVKEGSVTASPVFDTNLRSQARVGTILFVLLFGFGGIWATTAPIDGAALASGQVTVRSYSKTVQHLEGGIIQNIFVDNGERVELGDPILKIDDTQSLAQLEIAKSQQLALRALEARLIAERDERESLIFGSEMVALGPRAQEEIAAQLQIFNARRITLQGSVEVLNQRTEQLQSQIEGFKGLRSSKEVLSKSYAEELRDTRDLLSQGFSDKNSLRQLERNIAVLDGEAAELDANIASTEVQIGEANLQILQQRREFNNQVVAELGEVQTNLNDTEERVIAFEDIVSRTVIRAPDSGLVNGLQVHTLGGVITPGMRILDVVPEGDDLIIEARVSPTDIDRVAIGQNATIRFSTFGMGSVPTIYGSVINLSADILTDEALGFAYYLARVEVSPEGLEGLGDLSLMPGMPAEVFIATGSRTLFEYLSKPLSNALARSLRED